MSSSKNSKLEPHRNLKHRFILFRIAEKNRAVTLLAMMFLQIVLQQLSDYFALLSLFLQLGLILSAIFMVADSKLNFTVGIAAGIPAGVILIATRNSGYTNISWLAYGLILFLYLHVIRLMLIHIFKTTKVTLDTIATAMCTYILLGILWTLFYLPVAVLIPDSFSFNDPSETASIFDSLHYFSFVTLTTLGYGDILPLSPLARSLAILEAVIGTLFLAVLISRLVGSYSSARREK